MSERPSGADLRGIIGSSDVRGVAGEELSAEVARALGAAFVDHLAEQAVDGAAPAVIVARDARASSPELAAAVVAGAAARGATVADAGPASTDQLYCASGLHDAAGVMVTASHNPPGDNGLKLCLPGARPVSRDTGLAAIGRRAERYLDEGSVPEVAGGRVQELDTLTDYVDTVLDLVPMPAARPLAVVVDAGHGMAGLTAPAVLGRLPGITLRGLHLDLDGSFPAHPPNPLDPANLRELRQAVRKAGADLGLAFDGDADRCVVVDERGEVVTPSALTALIATREIARVRAAGAERPVVIANAVSSRHVAEAVREAGGEPLSSPVGHSLIKALMAEHEAVFGGEHSAHYYFRDFFRADSGMLAALHVIAALAGTDGPASALVAAHDPYPSSGEINARPADPAAALARGRAVLEAIPGTEVDELDGLSLVHWDEDAAPAERWWVSLRPSHTEKLLRLNVEAAEEDTMARIRDRVLEAIAEPEAADPEPVQSEPEPVEQAASAPSSVAELPRWVRERLRCPDCGGALVDAERALRCTDCSRAHPVQDGIPVLIAGRTAPPA